MAAEGCLCLARQHFLRFRRRSPRLVSSLEGAVEVSTERLREEEQDRPQRGDGSLDGDAFAVGGVSISFPKLERAYSPSCDEEDRRDAERRHRHPVQQGFLAQSVHFRRLAVRTIAPARRRSPRLASGDLLTIVGTQGEGSWPRFGGQHGASALAASARTRRDTSGRVLLDHVALDGEDPTASRIPFQTSGPSSTASGFGDRTGTRGRGRASTVHVRLEDRPRGGYGDLQRKEHGASRRLDRTISTGRVSNRTSIEDGPSLLFPIPSSSASGTVPGSDPLLLPFWERDFR